MPPHAPFTIALRIAEVRLGADDLEARLGIELDRFEPSKKSSFSYAQVDIDGREEPWAAILRDVARLGPALRKLLSDGAASSVVLDIGLAMAPDAPMMTRTIPAAVAEVAGRCGIDIDVSVYVTSDHSAKPTDIRVR